MHSGTANQHRSIVLGIDQSEFIELKASEWLAVRSPGTSFALAELANPTRDGGQVELVLALDEIAPQLFSALISELQLASAGVAFEAHAPHLSDTGQN